MEFGQFWRENRWTRDAVLPTVLLLAALVTGIGSGSSGLLSLLLIVPLYWRRHQPELVFGVTLLMALGQLALREGILLADLAIPIVVHASAAYARDRRWGWAALMAGLTGSVVGPLVWFADRGRYVLSLSTDLLVLMAIAALVVVGAYLLGRREVSHAVESRAATAERDRLLAQDRDQRAEMAAATERTRIARELHDIVAHSLSVVVVQADGGIAAAQAKPEIAPQVLDTIATTARAALADMRRLVGVLRSGAGAESDHPDYAPAPTPADLPDLVEQVRSAGRDVELLITGTERELSAGIGLTVYRLVQESLTNIIKHAGPTARAEVSVNYAPEEIHVSVIDDGRGAAAFSDGLGNGLTGMRERVTLQGGTVAAHPRAGGGFLVMATIPTGPGPLRGPDPRR